MRAFSLLAFLLAFSGCDKSEANDPAPASGCADDAAIANDTGAVDSGVAEADAPAAPAREALTWSVEFPATSALAELPSIVFRGAAGLAPAQTEVVETTGTVAARTITPFDGFGGDTKDATELAGWYGKIAAWTPCDGCDANREWVKASADLARPAIVSALTKDGQWLARWKLSEAWPASFFGAKRKDGRFEVGSLTLAGAAPSFELNPANPWLAKVLASAGVSKAKLPDATIGFGKAPDFATAALARPFLGVDGLVGGLGNLATSTPLYEDTGLSGDNPLFEGTERSVLPPTIEIRDGDKTLLRGVGIVQDVDIVEYRNGDDPVTHKRPGRTKYKNITLRRADVVDPSVLSWLDQNFFGKVERKSGSVILVDREGSEVMRTALTNATPAPLAVVPARIGPTDWAVPETAARWQRAGIGHTLNLKIVSDPK